MALRIRHTTSDRPAVTPERKAHPLFWLLVLVALLVIVWSLYNRYASHATSARIGMEATTPASRPVSRIVDAQPLRPARTSRLPRP
jgi:nicotinamide riboside transporter PnuC